MQFVSCDCKEEERIKRGSKMEEILKSLENPSRIFSFNAYNQFSICIEIGRVNDDINELITNIGRSIIFDYHILIDYGIPFPVNTNIKDDIFYTAAKNYSLLSNRRAQACRQALLALIRVCKGNLRGLRSVILEIAKQVWSQRGPKGCGPRGHLWGPVV
jgi:hypothetical protein